MTRGGEIDLAELVTNGDVDATTEACLSVLEDPSAVNDRAGLVARCTRILEQGWWSGNGHTPEQYYAAAAVVTALATEAELRRMRRRVLPQNLDDAYRLLVAREPAFRDRWAEMVMADVDPGEVRVARRLVHSGQAAKPTTDEYTIALVGRPISFDVTGEPNDLMRRHHSVLSVLRANPDLLVDDVWRIFEVEGAGENSLAAHDKYQDEADSWRHAVVTLGREGTLDRDRLLDASLDALQRGFAQFRAQWFASLHEALEPSVDERAARSSTYLALSASPVGPTVSLALKALAQVQKADRMDPPEVVRSIGPALLTPAKGPATKAVALLATAVRADATLLDEAVGVMASALAHPSADVQERALGHLRRWQPEPGLEIAGHIEALRDGCHPLVRANVDEWLSRSSAGSDREVSQPTTERSRAEEPWETEVTPLISVTAIDWLTPSREIVLINDVDSLLEHVAAAIESPPSGDEIEVLLASMAALGREPTADRSQAGTVARRAAKLAKVDRFAQKHLARAVTAWLAPERLPAAFDPTTHESPPPTVGTGPISLHDLLAARLGEVAAELATGRRHIPLATPTHRGGFLDPGAFAARLTSDAEPPGPAELLAAVLRLAPDRERLQEAESLLRSHGVDLPDGTSRVLSEWVLAWMSGWADHCERDATIGGTWTSEEWSGESGYRHFSLHVDGAGEITPPGTPHPVVSLGSPWGRCGQDPVAVGWMGTLLPGLPAAFAREGATTIGPTYGTSEVVHGDPSYVDHFFDPTVPLVPASLLLLAFALNDHRRGVQAIAVDLAIETIDDRRLDVAALGEQIGRLASTGLVTPGRWSRSLADVAGHGPAHRLAVIHCIERAVAVAEPRRPQDVLPLLEVLEHLAVEANQTVLLPEARAALARLTGSSRTTKTAKRLLDLGPS